MYGEQGYGKQFKTVGRNLQGGGFGDCRKRIFGKHSVGKAVEKTEGNQGKERKSGGIKKAELKNVPPFFSFVSTNPKTHI